MEKTKTIDFVFQKKLLKEVLKRFGNDFILKKLNRNNFYASVETNPIEFYKWAKEEELYILEND